MRTAEQRPIEDIWIEEDDWDAKENDEEMQKQGNFKKPKVKQSFGPMDPVKSQYNIVFSAEFGPGSVYEARVVKKDEEAFLKQQYFLIQKYTTRQEFHPFRIYELRDHCFRNCF